LLKTLPLSTTWRQVFDGTSACVSSLEHRFHLQPSAPQAYFGDAVRDLSVRF
jgi:hypothetical protein